MKKLYKGKGYWTGGDIDLGSAGGCVDGGSSAVYFIAADSEGDAIRALQHYLNSPDWKIRKEDIKIIESGNLELKMLEKLNATVEKVSELKWRWEKRNKEIEIERERDMARENRKYEIRLLEGIISKLNNY